MVTSKKWAKALFKFYNLDRAILINTKRQASHLLSAEFYRQFQLYPRRLSITFRRRYNSEETVPFPRGVKVNKNTCRHSFVIIYLLVVKERLQKKKLFFYVQIYSRIGSFCQPRWERYGYNDHSLIMNLNFICVEILYWIKKTDQPSTTTAVMCVAQVPGGTKHCKLHCNNPSHIIMMFVRTISKPIYIYWTIDVHLDS